MSCARKSGFLDNLQITAYEKGRGRDRRSYTPSELLTARDTVQLGILVGIWQIAQIMAFGGFTLADGQTLCYNGILLTIWQLEIGSFSKLLIWQTKFPAKQCNSL